MASTHTVTLVLVLVAAAISVQDRPAFTTTARLVELTVVALDKNGVPVTDLEKADFKLFDGGKQREIAFCRYEGGPAPEVRIPALPPNIFTNRVEFTTGPPRNIVALVFDSINTEVEEQRFVNAQMMQLLRALGSQTRVAVFHIGRNFRVLHDFTDDMAFLRDRLRRLEIEFPTQSPSDIERLALQAEEFLKNLKPGDRREGAAATERAVIAGEVNFNTVVRGNRVEATLAMLESMSRHLSGIPGRKSVVWISSGIATTSARVSTTGSAGNHLLDPVFEPSIRRTSNRLADMGVSLYAIDAHGLVPPATSGAQLTIDAFYGQQYADLRQADAAGRDIRAAFGLMTSVTGGRAFFQTNDFAEPVRRIVDDFRGTYSLGFYLSGEPDGKWHTLKAEVTRPGVSVVHRKGYTFIPDRRRTWGTEELRQALANPLGSSSIHLNARCDPVARDPGKLQLTIQIEAEDLKFLDIVGTRKAAEAEIVISEISATGIIRFHQETTRATLTAEQLKLARENGIPYTRVWKHAPDTALIRVLVRDRSTGRFGTLDLPISAILKGTRNR